MRTVLSVAVSMALALVLAVGARAEDKKEVTLKGKVMCGKCQYDKVLKALDVDKPESCQIVFVVKGKKKDDKATVYYFDADSHKKFHGDLCKKNVPATVTGTVTEDGGKKTIKVSELEYKGKPKDE
jgi:hypothetical protein